MILKPDLITCEKNFLLTLDLIKIFFNLRAAKLIIFLSFEFSGIHTAKKSYSNLRILQFMTDRFVEIEIKYLNFGRINK